MGGGEEKHGSLRAVELRDPQKTVHDPKGWEAQRWSWYLQVLARMGSASAPTALGSQGITRATWDPS